MGNNNATVPDEFCFDLIEIGPAVLSMAEAIKCRWQETKSNLNEMSSAESTREFNQFLNVIGRIVKRGERIQTDQEN